MTARLPDLTNMTRSAGSPCLHITVFPETDSSVRQFAIATGHRHEIIFPSDLLQASREASGLALSRLQAEAIGALRLIQLVGLEIEKLVADYAELLSKIRDYEAILADDVLVRNIIREDCTDLLEKFDTPRLTTFEEAEEGDFDMGAFVKEHTVAVSRTTSGVWFARRFDVLHRHRSSVCEKGLRSSRSFSHFRREIGPATLGTQRERIHCQHARLGRLPRF